MTRPNTALLLSYITVVYNVFEGVISVVFAHLAGSPALLGFGIDSFVESLSGLVMNIAPRYWPSLPDSIRCNRMLRRC